MKKKPSKSNAITYPGFVHLHRPLLECNDVCSLSHNSFRLLVYIANQYNGRNNGDLCATLSVLRRYGFNSNDSITRGLRQLVKHNLITQTKQGGLNIGPNLYAITWQPIDECGGKLEVPHTLSPPRFFK